MNNRRKLVIALGAGALAAPLASFAQQQCKVWRVGMLETTSKELNAANLNAFLKGMQELGYVEGRNFVIDYRSVDGRGDRFPDLAAELVRGKVDLIVTRGTPSTLAAKAASRTIPIVMTTVGDPLLVAASLARPGGNITGLSSVSADLHAKRLELLKESLPKITRTATMLNMGNPIGAQEWKEITAAARILGLRCQLFDVRKLEDIVAIFDTVSNLRIEAIVVGIDGLLQANGKLIAALAAKARIPTAFASTEFVDAGV